MIIVWLSDGSLQIRQKTKIQKNVQFNSTFFEEKN